MQIVCALAVLLATLAMLGVPKDHGGPRRDPRLRSRSCKWPPKNFGAQRAGQRHVGSRPPHKCDAVAHGKRSAGGEEGEEGGKEGEGCPPLRNNIQKEKERRKKKE